jgi:putative transposase
MWTRLLHRLLAAGRTAAQALRRRVAAATRPETASLGTGTLADLARTMPELRAENALLRQQLLILRRQM